MIDTLLRGSSTPAPRTTPRTASPEITKRLEGLRDGATRPTIRNAAQYLLAQREARHRAPVTAGTPGAWAQRKDTGWLRRAAAARACAILNRE